jgi:hypothetical protein
MDLSLSIAIGSSVQIALFVAPVLVFASLFIGPTLLDLAFPAGLVLMVLLSVLRLSPWHARPRFPDRDDKDADEDAATPSWGHSTEILANCSGSSVPRGDRSALPAAT